MIFRIAAAVLDAWLRLGRLRRRVTLWLGGGWAALPAEPLARLVLLGCGLAPDGGVGRTVPGPAGVGVRLVEDPRLARYLDLMPVRPYAQTVGRYVLCRERLPEATLRHELEHVRQWRRLGPLFLPAYLAASGLARARGGDSYRDNRFERAARARERCPTISGG